MRIRFVGLNGAVVIPDLGNLVVHPGDEFDAPDHIAGRPPDPRLIPCMEDIHAAIGRLDHDGAQLLREELASLDVGVGLLAQCENWHPVVVTKAARKTAESKEG